MLSYFSSKTPATKNDNAEKKLAMDERLVHYQDYIELDKKLQLAKDRIQELETILETKEQLHDELHQKIHLLTTAIAQEKLIAKEQQAQFTEEEDTLVSEIATLKVDLLKQEAHYENLRKKIIGLQEEQETKLALQQQYKNLQLKMNEKEREYEILVNKIAELESAKQQAEERLIQEKNDHKETKSALELEKKSRHSNKSFIDTKKDMATHTLPAIANNNTTLFSNTNQQPKFRKPLFMEPWELYADF